MAELTPQERLQPALLDRLTDDAPDEHVEARERRVLSMHRLRNALLRDLAWLLNAGNLESVQELADFPEVRRSVLNYGIPDLTGLTLAGTDPALIEKAIREAILRFEPRIAPHSLRVTAMTEDNARGRSALVFRIEGEIWAKPAAQPLYLKTEVDLETGDAILTEGQV